MEIIHQARDYKNLQKKDQLAFFIIRVHNYCSAIMNEFGCEKSGEPSESDLYQDLSRLMKILKKIVDTMDIIITLLLKQQHCVDLIRKLREMLPEHRKLISHYNFEIDELSPHCNTYYRFVCRLMENVTPYKNRINVAHPIVAVFAEFLNKTQLSIGSYKIQRNIGKIFKKIFVFTLKFCQTFDFSQENDYLQEMDPLANPMRQQQKHSIQKINQTAESPLSLTKTKFISTESNFHKVISGLNRQFATISCLDINYNDYKSMFFRSNHEKDDLYDDTMKRNCFILRQINNYSKHFQEYLKRRDKPHVSRKNRFIENRQVSEYTASESCSKEKSSASPLKKTIDASEADQKAFNLFSKVTELPMLQERTLRVQKQEKRIDLKDSEKRKTSYQLKSVFLTINKIHSHNMPHHQRQADYATSNPCRSNNSYQNKSNNHSTVRSNKYSMRSAKIIEEEEAINRPPLQIKQYDFKNMKAKIQQSTHIHVIGGRQLGETKTSYLSKFYCPKKGLSEKKSIRVTQIAGKSLKYSRFLKESNCVELDHDEFYLKALNNGQAVVYQ